MTNNVHAQMLQFYRKQSNMSDALETVSFLKLSPDDRHELMFYLIMNMSSILRRITGAQQMSVDEAEEILSMGSRSGEA